MVCAPIEWESARDGLAEAMRQVDEVASNIGWELCLCSCLIFTVDPDLMYQRLYIQKTKGG